MLKMAYAQNQTITIFGYVHDVNNNPIEMVNIVIENSSQGTTSDQNGIFKLPVSKDPLKMIFSHVSYKKQELKITKSALEEALATGILTLDILMESNVKMLPPVSISDSKIQMAYRNKKSWILDYALIGEDEILLLLINKNRKYLQLINYLHEKIAVTPVDYKYRDLYKGCFGDIHLLSNNDACQIFLMDDKFYLMHHIPKDEFINTIEKTMVATSHYLYLKEASPQNQNIAYYKIDTINKSKTLLYTITNQLVSELQREQQEIYNDLISVGEGTDMSLSVSASSMREIAKSTNQEAQAIRMNFAYTTYRLFQEPYLPLFQINDELCLFNHIDGELVKFSLTGEQTGKIKINYHLDDGWNKEIIVNEEKTRCFAKFIHNGKTSLAEISLNTGQTTEKYVLEVHAFPTKIKVRGNEIYYLSKDYFEGEEKYFLWKQKLE
jgi:hypothetical protein